MTTLQLYNDDCLEKMKSIADKSIDLIICDLPYGCLRRGGGEEKKRRRFKDGVDTGTEIIQTEGVFAGCDWDIKINLELFWKQIKRIRKNEHTPTLHFCSTKFGIDLINSNPKEFRYDLVWVKPSAVGFLNANKKPMSSHEMIYVFSKAGANYNRIDNIGGKAYSFMNKENKEKRIKARNIKGPVVYAIDTINTGIRCVKSTIEIKNTREKGAHPTAKPVELYKWLIERYSSVGNMVLDPTFGSCNSGLASKELERNYIGIEKDEEFFKKAESRFNNGSIS